MEYKIKFDQLWTPGYGFCQAGTVGVDAETVRLSGTRVYGLMLMVGLIPLASFSNKIVGMWLGFQLKLIPLAVICTATLLILYYRKKSLFNTSVSLEKRLITNLDRNGKKVGFCIPDPEGIGGPPVKVILKTNNEEEAVKLENELRS